ncbi:2-C-methyl-D-erythritol 2,4-cyclodiphosphate synthase [Chloroflexota bacterium]
MRIGFGYDVHRLVVGRPLVLGGVEVPNGMGLEGWSDGDVLTHAVIDALLGAVALGDIGAHFPPGDPEYKDVSSILLLARVGALLAGRGFRVGNIDVTVVAREPSLGPFVDRIRQALAGALDIDRNLVGVKAKTSNGLGFAGRGEGIAAHAVASVEQI